MTFASPTHSRDQNFSTSASSTHSSYQNFPLVLPQLIPGIRTFHLCFPNSFQEPELSVCASTTQESEFSIKAGVNCAFPTHLGTRNFHLCFLNSLQESEPLTCASLTNFRNRIFHLLFSKKIMKPG
jgi:hypothetical protein